MKLLLHCSDPIGSGACFWSCSGTCFWACSGAVLAPVSKLVLGPVCNCSSTCFWNIILLQIGFSSSFPYLFETLPFFLRNRFNPWSHLGILTFFMCEQQIFLSKTQLKILIFIHIFVLLPPQYNISCVDISNQALFWRKTTRFSLSHIWDTLSILCCKPLTKCMHIINQMGEWLIHLTYTNYCPRFVVFKCHTPSLSSSKWEKIEFFTCHVPRTPTVNKSELIAPCSVPRTVIWLVYRAVPSHLCLQNRLVVSFGNPDFLGSHSFQHKKVFFPNPVSYTHLTLPTNREV